MFAILYIFQEKTTLSSFIIKKKHMFTNRDKLRKYIRLLNNNSVFAIIVCSIYLLCTQIYANENLSHIDNVFTNLSNQLIRLIGIRHEIQSNIHVLPNTKLDFEFQ